MKHIKLRSSGLMVTVDYPHELPEEEILEDVPQFIQTSGLSDEVMEKILCHNARRFYRIDERIAQRVGAQ